MEQEIIETVLKEILDEIKLIHYENLSNQKCAKELKNKIQSPEESLIPFEMKLDFTAKKIERIINEQPKNVVRKIQILLFPETGAREYYRLVFGRLFFWLMMFLLATYLFSLGLQFVDSWKDIEKTKMKLFCTIHYPFNQKLPTKLIDSITIVASLVMCILMKKSTSGISIEYK